MGLTTKEKLEKHYNKRANLIKGYPEREEKLLIRVQQKYDAKDHFDSGLAEIQNRVWEPKTKSIAIPLEDLLDEDFKIIESGRLKTVSFNSEKEFDDWKANDIKNVQAKLKHIGEEQLELEELHRRVFN